MYKQTSWMLPAGITSGILARRLLKNINFPESVNKIFSSNLGRAGIGAGLGGLTAWGLGGIEDPETHETASDQLARTMHPGKDLSESDLGIARSVTLPLIGALTGAGAGLGAGSLYDMVEKIKALRRTKL